MHLVPKHEFENKPKHLRASDATIASASLAAPGTGFVYVPIYAWATASAVGSVRYLNGTGGSALFELKVSTGGVSVIDFWEEPSALSANKCPVIESQTAGMGVNDCHVWLMKVRAAAGQDGLTQ